MVTAAGSGIGRETALLCARLGAALALCDLDEEGLQSTARAANALGAEVLIERLDVADPERMGVFAARVHERFDTVELLVNNTDMGVIATFLDTELSDWRYLAMAILRAVGHDRAVAPVALEARLGYLLSRIAPPLSRWTAARLARLAG